MATFQKTRNKAEQKVLMGLLNAIEKNPSFTQRGLSSDLGVALGLMNQYLKRCVTKGWVRASQVSPRRIAYFLTPEGFKEKSQMVRDYLSSSLSFFRDARSQCDVVFRVCLEKGFFSVALAGKGDLADIAALVAQSTELKVKIVPKLESLKGYDAVLITDIADPQGTYDRLQKKIDPARILVLDLLHISKAKKL